MRTNSLRALTLLGVLSIAGPVAAVVTAPAAAAQDGGITISGTAWQDLDRDGVRQAGEPALRPIPVDGPVIVHPRLVTPDGTTLEAVNDFLGGYRFEHVLPGTYRLLAPTRGIYDDFALTAGGSGSAIDQVTGTSAPIVVTADSSDQVLDIGYFHAAGTEDLAVERLTAQPSNRTVRAGEEITYRVRGVNRGLPADWITLRGTWSPELTLVSTAGDAYRFEGPESMSASSWRKYAQGDALELTVVLRAERAVAHADVSFTVDTGAFGDRRPANNTASRWLHVKP